MFVRFIRPDPILQYELGPGDFIFVPKCTVGTTEIRDRLVLTYAATPIN